MQVDCCHFENGAQESGSSLWTFKLEFGLIHTTNCSVCRSYMTHVAVANHSGDASFKDAINTREARVSGAFLDGLQSGRQIQQEHDTPVLSRYRDERDKTLQELDAAKKEMTILRNKVLSLELAVQDPVSERESKRSDESIGSSTESSAKSDLSSVERLLLSPSEDLDFDDAPSTPFLSTAVNHDPPLIPNLQTAAEDREAFHTPDPANPLGSSLASIEPLGETTVSTENVPQSSALLLKASSSATPEPAKPSSRPSTTIKSWAQLAKASSATPKPERSSPRPSTYALGLSNTSSDHQSLSLEPFGEANIATTTVRKLSWAQLARPSSAATPKPEKPSPQPSTWALNLSNLSSSDQRSSSVEPPGETSVSTTNVRKLSWAQLARPSSAATPKPSPQPSTSALNMSNLSTLDQQSSSVEPPGETNVSTTNVRKSWAQLARSSSSATPKPEKLSPQLSSCALSLSNPSSSDQQSSSILATSPSPRPPTTIAHVEALMKAAHTGDDSSLTRIRAFCGTARRLPRKQRTELQRYALLHWRKPSPSLSSSVSSTETGTRGASDSSWTDCG
ncbi:hypothetical protein M378DRAFT_27836 [Amanita muscaria Koide BX008]|uniref:Uncharacterized protein n=1 Tax=Amanita muscaria (strain Koide BX008) TaxID=946122 RepID=A0A0C2WM35_AMAMK|nr:hypothetical protein M378DRAFT_27836 [Amanita muscaria Koide BX008]